MFIDVVRNQVIVGAYTYDIPKGIRCIDDREERQPRDELDPLPDIAVPGAAVGFYLGLLGGANLLKQSEKKIEIDSKISYDVAKEVVGDFLYHSDEKKVDDLNPCAGCGHVASALRDPAAYLLNDEQLQFIQSTCLPELSANKKNRVLYSGDHQAKAVVVIDSLNLGCPNLFVGGNQVYVYSRAEHERLMLEAAKKISTKMGFLNNKSAEEDIKSAFFEAAKIQITKTVQHLAEGLPVLRLTVDSAGNTDAQIETKAQ